MKNYGTKMKMRHLSEARLIFLFFNLKYSLELSSRLDRYLQGLGFAGLSHLVQGPSFHIKDVVLAFGFIHHQLLRVCNDIFWLSSYQLDIEPIKYWLSWLQNWKRAQTSKWRRLARHY
jgi:hypothetical protein